MLQQVEQPNPASRLIELRDVTKRYQSGSNSLAALKTINIEIDRGEFVAVVGKSGSGKSTLINVITGIDTPTDGEVLVAATPVHALDQETLAEWRGNNIGIVFQFFQLLPTLTVLENVMLPMDFGTVVPANQQQARALVLLGKVGIVEQAHKLPATLSGGQQQRAAIARSLANDPSILVADEPTGNLDTQTAEEVMGLFAQLVKDGKTVVMVTHERDFQHYFTRTIVLADGSIVSDEKVVEKRLK